MGGNGADMGGDGAGTGGDGAGTTNPTSAAREKVGSGWPNSEHGEPHLVGVLGVGSAVPVYGGRDERIGAIAEVQRGHITRRQLRAAGISDSAIARMIAAKRLIRIHPAVYAVRPCLPVPLGPETAALLACGPNALLSHGSAASLWKLCQRRHGPVELTVTRRRHRHVSGVHAHRTGHLLGRDIRVIEGLPVTSPARTLLDRAATLTVHELERELDEALSVLRIVRRRELSDVLARGNGRNGAAVLRRLLERRTDETITQSEAERLFLRLVQKARLPEPETQVRLAGYTVDFLWPEARVVFERDGYRFHSTRRAFDRDRRKDLALKEAHYDPNRVSRDQVKHEPEIVVAHVAGALARAGMPTSP